MSKVKDSIWDADQPNPLKDAVEAFTDALNMARECMIKCAVTNKECEEIVLTASEKIAERLTRDL